jgi:hypothetical protein
MASLILGAAIFTAIHIRDRKDKKKEKARQAAEAHDALVSSQMQVADGIYRGNNFPRPSLEALPAYTPALKRRASSVYSQDSGATGLEAGQRTQKV